MTTDSKTAPLPMPQAALRHADAASYLGVSGRTLHRWTAARAIRRVKRGRVILYPLAELDRFLTENTRERRGGRG